MWRMIWTIDPELRLGFGIIRGESKPLRTPPRNKGFSHSLNTDLTTHNPSCSLASTFNITLTKKSFVPFPHFHRLIHSNNATITINYNFCCDLSHNAQTNLYRPTIFSPSLITRHVKVCVAKIVWSVCSLNFSINSLILSTAVIVGLGWTN